MESDAEVRSRVTPAAAGVLALAAANDVLRGGEAFKPATQGLTASHWPSTAN